MNGIILAASFLVIIFQLPTSWWVGRLVVWDALTAGMLAYFLLVVRSTAFSADAAIAAVTITIMLRVGQWYVRRRERKRAT